ncbi:MAG: hypothetical protein K9K67_10725 [Bacteriovoracaceae bacterium]|nr:hypothetical protein [Bacteriovoracaceae bacterium]
MKIIFLSQDGSIQNLIEGLEGDIHGVETPEEVLELLEEVDEDEDCLLFLDFDIDKKALENFNKSIFKNEWLTRIIVSGTMTVKEFKKHQKGKTSAHGYVLKPFTAKVLKGILNDLEISHFLEEQNLYEEGTTLPELPNHSNQVKNADSDEEDDGPNDSEFDPQEFQMNTQVRSLVDKHSIKGESSPFAGELNDKIQMKFDQVFGKNPRNNNSRLGESDDSFIGAGEMDLSLKDETLGGISLNLGEESTELSNTSEMDLNSDNEEFLLDEDAAEFQMDEDSDLDSGAEEFALIEETNDDSGDGEFELIEEDEDDSGDGDFELIEEEDEGVLEFVEEEILEKDDNNEEIDLDEDLDEEDVEDELTRLTENRMLPSSEELSEFDEETGEFEVDGDISKNESVVSLEKNDQEINEVKDMSDDNQDDLLEFDEEELSEDGELSFSTEPEAGGVKQESSNDEEGGLDFDLSGLDEDDINLEESTGSDESGSGFKLDEDESFDLGTDAALSSADSSEDDFQLEDDSAGENISSDPVENSEFDDDELNFSEDDDEEIEKTQAISLSGVKGSHEGPLEDEDALDLGDDGLDFGTEEGDDELDLGSEEGEDELALGAEAREDIAVENSDEDLDFGAEDDSESLDEFDSDEDLLDNLSEDSFEENTNPTMVMTKEVARDLEDMIDHQSSTHEFRPGEGEATAILDDEFLDDESFDEPEEELDLKSNFEEEKEEDVVEEVVPVRTKEPEGTLNITAHESRIPPSLNEGEAVRLQATIRQLREEREDLLKDIQNLKKENKLVEQDNLGLKAELDEAKIEISILKKRHGSELDEMKYRLRLTDEKKLYSEEKARKLQKEFDRLQSKVRIDFNHIKQREKELESQLELVKMDSESQVQSRDKKILELKRKIDQLEFNMENVVIREQKSRDDKMKVEERLERIMKTLRGSIEVLEDDISFDSNSKRKRD